MKNYFYILITFLLIVLSCNKIENPIPPIFGDLDWSLYPGDSNDYLDLYNFDFPDSNWSLNLNTKKYILLEDYTGHKCNNCPEAAIVAEELEADTALGVILVTIHAGPSGQLQATDETYTTDFTTDAGDIYVVDMPGMFANPMGTINRKNLGLNGTVWHLANSWENAVNQEVNQTLQANIQLQTNYFPSTKGLFIHTKTEFKVPLTGNYSLVIYLIRKSVIKPQTMFNGTTNYNYNHHNILSENVNGTWGTSIVSGDIDEESVFYNDFSFELPNDSTYNIDNLSLVTYICDRNTFEVIQVVKTAL